MISRLFYGPSDWVSRHSNARLRRALGFWIGATFFLATVLTWSARDSVSVVWALTIAGLLLVCWSIVSTETPVETED